MLVWNDIAKYTNDYKNGIKKLDSIVNDADKAQNNKLNYKKNKFKLHSSTDDYGLDDKITIRSMKFKTSNDLKDMFKNKSTPSHLLKGKVELSSGTQNVINMQNKMIPKVDHSYIDPGYYEHKLEGKTNNDLILKEMSSGKDFAKQYVAGLPKRTNLLNDINKGIELTTPSTPPTHQKPEYKYNELSDGEDEIFIIPNSKKKELEIKSALLNNNGNKDYSTFKRSQINKMKFEHIEPEIEDELEYSKPLKKINQNKNKNINEIIKIQKHQKMIKPNELYQQIKNDKKLNLNTINDLNDKMNNLKQNKSATTIQKNIRTKLAQNKYENLKNENKIIGSYDKKESNIRILKPPTDTSFKPILNENQKESPKLNDERTNRTKNKLMEIQSNQQINQQQLIINNTIKSLKELLGNMPVKDQRKVEITQQHKQSIIDTLQKQGIKNTLPPKSLRVTEIISKLV